MKLSDPAVDQYPALDEKLLSPVAQKAVSRVLKSWNCTDDEAARLFGVEPDHWIGVSRGDFEYLLSQDQLLRASYLIGIYSGLQVFSDDTAKRWPKLPNTGPIFRGKTPVEFMLEGGLEAMEKTRRYTDCLGY
ncbi:DUF2384 domain-containing protein [Rhizobium sp. MHM7A]|uniref:DUF2384 domain-containing protein n=1 Tax=Rhizobium sp. MHM7A TaxID=2583233 RepID=UPI001106F4BB|nr:DUF2384 domain-containing protein [Rhizobium sp. MHM7A]TLX16147.1 DUF2384 domain-containing protein [Rhizobium sp. MHM7A]